MPPQSWHPSRVSSQYAVPVKSQQAPPTSAGQEPQVTPKHLPAGADFVGPCDGLYAHTHSP